MLIKNYIQKQKFIYKQYSKVCFNDNIQAVPILRQETQLKIFEINDKEIFLDHKQNLLQYYVDYFQKRAQEQKQPFFMYQNSLKQQSEQIDQVTQLLYKWNSELVNKEILGILYLTPGKNKIFSQVNTDKFDPLELLLFCQKINEPNSIKRLIQFYLDNQFINIFELSLFLKIFYLSLQNKYQPFKKYWNRLKQVEIEYLKDNGFNLDQQQVLYKQIIDKIKNLIQQKNQQQEIIQCFENLIDSKIIWQNVELQIFKDIFEKIIDPLIQIQIIFIYAKSNLNSFPDFAHQFFNQKKNVINEYFQPQYKLLSQDTLKIPNIEYRQDQQNFIGLDEIAKLYWILVKNYHPDNIQTIIQLEQKIDENIKKYCINELIIILWSKLSYQSYQKIYIENSFKLLKKISRMIILKNNMLNINRSQAGLLYQCIQFIQVVHQNKIAKSVFCPKVLVKLEDLWNDNILSQHTSVSEQMIKNTFTQLKMNVKYNTKIFIYYVDIFIYPNTIIEINGDHHQSKKFYQDQTNFVNANFQFKQTILESLNYKLITIDHTEYLNILFNPVQLKYLVESKIN